MPYALLLMMMVQMTNLHILCHIYCDDGSDDKPTHTMPYLLCSIMFKCSSILSWFRTIRKFLILLL
jgi:hypothetical protein